MMIERIAVFIWILCILIAWLAGSVILMYVLMHSAPVDDRWELHDLRAMRKSCMQREEWNKEEVTSKPLLSRNSHR